MKPAKPRLQYAPTGVTNAPATIPQEYFWAMALDDPDPSTYTMSSVFVIEGDLDVDLMHRTIVALVAAHGVFRTALREVGSELRQVVLPPGEAPPFALELVDRAPVPEAEWAAEGRRGIEELTALGLDLAEGRVVRARLTRLADRHHLLVVVFHHAAADAVSSLAFFRRLFELYAGAAGGAPPAPLQYVDVVEAFTRFTATPEGQARATYWRERLRGAPPVRLPGDPLRADVDARRDAVAHGIRSDPMHPVEYVKLDPELREAVTRLAYTHRVSIFGVFAAALLWMLHQATGQTDLCIETSTDVRGEDPALAQVQGPLVFWTILRVDLAGCGSYEEALPRVGRAIAEAKQHGWLDDYYRQVPHHVRRVVLNYLPVRWFATPAREYPGLRLKYLPQRFPRWKRPWDLHLTILDADDVVFAWTGNEKLYPRETVVELLGRYLGILESSRTTPT